MIFARSITAAALFALSSLSASSAQPDLPTQEDSRLITTYESDRIWNAVTTTRDGRVFVGFPQADRPGFQVEELAKDGVGQPFPDADWNAGFKGGDVGRAFVLINSIRIGPEGDLWLVDAGAPASENRW